MGLFRRKKHEDPILGGLSAEPLTVTSAITPAVEHATPQVHVSTSADGTVTQVDATAVFGASGVIDARGIPGLREDVMNVALGGGTPEQIMAALKQHGIAIPDGLPVTMSAPGLEQLGAALQGQAAAGTEPDVAARLRELQQLKTDGLITDAEYTQRRAEIIDSI